MSPEQITTLLAVLGPLVVAVTGYVVAKTHNLDKRVSVNEVKLDGVMEARDQRSRRVEAVVTQQGLDAAAARGQHDAERTDHHDNATTPTIQGNADRNATVRPDKL